jgi:hypothetical protein
LGDGKRIKPYSLPVSLLEKEGPREIYQRRWGGDEVKWNDRINHLQ